MVEKMKIQALLLYFLAWSAIAAHQPPNVNKKQSKGKGYGSVFFPVTGNVYPKGYFFFLELFNGLIKNYNNSWWVFFFFFCMYVMFYCVLIRDIGLKLLKKNDLILVLVFFLLFLVNFSIFVHICNENNWELKILACMFIIKVFLKWNNSLEFLLNFHDLVFSWEGFWTSNFIDTSYSKLEKINFHIKKYALFCKFLARWS